MALKDAIRALVNAAPPDATVTVRWLAEQLAGDADDVRPKVTTPSTDVIDLSVADLAKRLKRSPSAVRAWCASGRLPGSYRMRGLEWRIPVAAIETMQREERRRHLEAGREAVRSPAKDTSEWRNHLPKAA